jgi:hypothetical protein
MTSSPGQTYVYLDFAMKIISIIYYIGYLLVQQGTVSRRWNAQYDLYSHDAPRSQPSERC